MLFIGLHIMLFKISETPQNILSSFKSSINNPILDKCAEISGALSLLVMDLIDQP